MKQGNQKYDQLKKGCLAFTLMIVAFGFSQERLVLPGQELFYQNLTDPSFTGEERRTQITALGQFVDFDTERASQYVNAQLPLYENLSFGLDYFKNKLDFYNYSQVIFTAAFEIPIGDADHVKIGLGGGGESLKLDRLPADLQSGTVIPTINENNIEFTYRVGLHYSGRNLTLGGTYTTLPSQSITPRQDLEDLLGYELLDGYTAYLGYRFRVGERFAVTPMFRYLSFTDDAIYEGSLKFQLKDRLDVSMAYRNDYSLNPAIRFRFFKSLAVGYSYEKAIGNLSFDDIHSIGLSYKFNKASAEEEPEWMETAKENIDKTESLEEKKPKKKKEVKKEIEKPETTIEEPKKAEVEETKETTETKTPVEEEPVVSTNETEQKVENRQSTTRAVTVVMSSRFYLIANSFDRFDSAFSFKKELENNGINALVGSIENDRKFYVFIDSDSDEKRANDLLSAYKGKDLLKGTYVLKVD